MAPDKIYLKGFSGNISQIWSRIKATETSADVQYEYIRKDALMEWLEGQLEMLKPLLDTDPYKEAYIGKCEAFKEVINKLNEM